MLKTKFKNMKGITLIALVITIIVLLILAGVSIAMLTGENGILTQAQRAKNETENAQAEEENILANYESVLNSYSGKNTEFTDSLGNIVKVPAGFKVVNPRDNVEDGIIIEDVTHGATAGSQFVWIPVGTIQTSNGNETITLSRYTFDSSGIPTGQGSNIINTYWQELSTSTYGNTTAKDIEGFKTSATTNGGYYIGRYEARTEIKRTGSTEDSGLTQITVNPNEYVYNCVTQYQAAQLTRNMYSDGNFTSDLMNSYAWDTAIYFLQKCDNRLNKSKPYSQQNSLKEGSVADKGTNNEVIKDIVCNVYDMASNCFEWTTETYSGDNGPCVSRGGDYSYSLGCSASRGYYIASTSIDRFSFRPLLYL